MLEPYSFSGNLGLWPLPSGPKGGGFSRTCRTEDIGAKGDAFRFIPFQNLMVPGEVALYCFFRGKER